MRSFTHSARPFLIVTTFLSLLSADAIAHIDLQSPISRYTNRNQNKACPCGVGESGNSRTCALPDDRSDPDRSTDRVTTLVAGSTLVIRFDEYVDHSGRYRIAFDNDGADLADFNDNILLDVVDPNDVQGSNGNAGGSMWELEITVPNTPCTNCTLQLIQVMNGNTVDEVPDPAGISTYYQCADVVIVAAGADGGTPATRDAGSTTAPDAGTTGRNDAGLFDAGPVAQDAGDVVTEDAGNVVAPDAGNTIVQDAGSTVEQDGGAVVDNDAGTINLPAEDAGPSAIVDAGDAPDDLDEGCRCVEKSDGSSWSLFAFAGLAFIFSRTRRRKHV